MKLVDALRSTERELDASGVPSARVDAEILLSHALGMSRSEVYASDRELEEAEIVRLRSLVDRRRRREPLAYVLGEWGFRRLTLAVDRRALVPRPETEVVVERCLALTRELAAPHVLDIGIGSGAIALAIADEHPGARVTGVDASRDAIALARENVQRTGLSTRVELVRGDLFAGLAGPFDLVVSNPPYVGAEEIPALAPEIRDYEPRSALVGPGVTAEIARGARDVLRPGGWLVLECGDGQASDVARMLGSFGYRDLDVTADLAGKDRVVAGRRP